MVRRINAKLVLQLRVEGMTGRAIAIAQAMSRKSVLAAFDAGDKAGIGSDGHACRSGAEVYALLFPGRGEHESVFVQPDWDGVHKELAKVRVTLKLLHGEHVCGCVGVTTPGQRRLCFLQRCRLLIGVPDAFPSATRPSGLSPCQRRGAALDRDQDPSDAVSSSGLSVKAPLPCLRLNNDPIAAAALEVASLTAAPASSAAVAARGLSGTPSPSMSTARNTSVA